MKKQVDKCAIKTRTVLVLILSLQCLNQGEATPPFQALNTVMNIPSLFLMSRICPLEERQSKIAKLLKEFNINKAIKRHFDIYDLVCVGRYFTITIKLNGQNTLSCPYLDKEFQFFGTLRHPKNSFFFVSYFFQMTHET